MTSKKEKIPHVYMRGETVIFVGEWNEMDGQNPLLPDVKIVKGVGAAETEKGRIVLANDYASLRQDAYPPAADYLDAVAKGDTAQQAAYREKCLAVKAKYPKPTG